MKASKILGICVYSLSTLGGLFLTIGFIPTIGAIFNLLFSQGFLGGAVMLVTFVLAVLWLVFSAIGLILFLTKGEGAGKKSNDFGLFSCRYTPALCAFFAVLASVLAFVFANPETAMNMLLGLLQMPAFYVLIVGLCVASILVKIAKKNTNKVTVAVLKGIAALLPFIGFMMFGPSILNVVAGICGLLALIGDVVVPFVEGK